MGNQDRPVGAHLEGRDRPQERSGGPEADDGEGVENLIAARANQGEDIASSSSSDTSGDRKALLNPSSSGTMVCVLPTWKDERCTS